MTDAATALSAHSAKPRVADRSSQLSELQAEMMSRLAGAAPETADPLFVRLAEVPGWLLAGPQLVHTLIRAAPNAAALESALLNMLLRCREVTFGSFRAIVKILELGAATGREEETFATVSAAAAGGGTSRARFSPYDLLNMLPRFDRKNLALLTEIKYGGAEKLLSKNIVAFADDLAERIALPFGLEDRLFAESANAAIPRDYWSARVREAFALDAAFADHSVAWNAVWGGSHPTGEAPYDTMIALTDMDAVRREFKALDPARGTLFVSLHGGFLNSVAFAFTVGSNNDGFMLGHVGGGKVISVQDPRAALFRGIRAIEDGLPVFVFADARAGKYNSSVSVLGTPLPMADGAPFIAHETGCETLWLGIERRRNGFAPQFVRGPMRREREKFVDFRERWLAFYIAQIERLLTGDPANLALRAQWMRMFSKNIDPHQIVA